MMKPADPDLHCYSTTWQIFIYYENSIGPDQLASDEANSSESTQIFIHLANILDILDTGKQTL